uniref:Tetraspanin family n=1 Tax=Schistocephalus solidus TaxID=70667 RepID=A0A0X3P7B4_SCHSO
MCCPCKEVLKFIIIFVNTLLGLGFLSLALLGVIMLTAPDFLRKIIDWFLYQFAVDVELTAITTFIKDNFSNLSMALITVGLIFACIAFLGAFASCCECTIVLGIYTALLGVFLVLQSLLLAVILLDKSLYMRTVTDSLSGLIRDYGSETGVATAIWSALMREVNSERCCGMDSSRDFIYSRLPTGICPKECCPWSYPQRCHCSEAQAQSMPGCRDRISTFVEENMQGITYILATVLGLQSLLFVLSTWQLCAGKCG